MFHDDDYDDDNWHKEILIVVYYPVDLYQNGYNIGFDSMEY